MIINLIREIKLYLDKKKKKNIKTYIEMIIEIEQKEIEEKWKNMLLIIEKKEQHQ